MRQIPSFQFNDGEMLKHKNLGVVCMIRIRSRAIDIDKLSPFYLVEIFDLRQPEEGLLRPRQMQLKDVEDHYVR